MGQKRSESERGDLRLRGTDAGKFKLVARKGYTAQDVTIVLKPGLSLGPDEIRWRMVDDAIDPPRDEPGSSYDALPDQGRLNMSGAEMRELRAARDSSRTVLHVT